jgi:hypothetical protein
MAQVKIKITEVLMAVARFELIDSTPSLANIAVPPANPAESKAQKTQVIVYATSRNYTRIFALLSRLVIRINANVIAFLGQTSEQSAQFQPR